MDDYAKWLQEQRNQKPEVKPKKLEKLEKKRQRRMADVEVIVISKGVNYRKTETLDIEKRNKVDVGGKKYEIDQSAFFLHKSRLPHSRKKYTIIFREGESKPLYMFKEKEGVSAGLLRIAKSSSALQRGLAELFESHLHLSARKLIFIFIVIGVAVVAVLILTGNLNLGALV
jgi:hypothetical protein